LSTYTTRWRQSLAHLRPGTLNNVDSFLHCHILPGFGTWQIGRIEPADIRTFVADLVEKGLAPSTVAAVYRVLARILATAEIDGVIPGTPCRGIKLPRQTTSTEPCFLSPAEVRRLAEAIEDRYRVLVYTAAYTGMRWGELAGLGVQRLDLLRGTMEVTEALTRSTATSESDRPRPARAELFRYPASSSTSSASTWRPFPRLTGTCSAPPKEHRFAGTFYRRHYKPAVKRAGLPIPSVSTTSATLAQPSSLPRAPTRRKSRSGSGTPPSSSPSIAMGTCSRALMSDCGTDSTPPGGPSRMLKSRAASWWNCGGRGQRAAHQKPPTLSSGQMSDSSTHQRTSTTQDRGSSRPVDWATRRNA